MSTLHAHVTAYKDYLVVELLAKQSIEGEVNTSLDSSNLVGQVIHDTKNHLGISAEAIALLKTIKKSHDGVGEVDWFATGDGKASFGWLGDIYVIFDPAKVGGSSTYNPNLEYTEIPNNVPAGAMAVIDRPQVEEQ